MSVLNYNSNLYDYKDAFGDIPAFWLILWWFMAAGARATLAWLFLRRAARNFDRIATD